MFCYQCGEKTEDGIEFCPYCGVELLETDNENSNESHLSNEMNEENQADYFYKQGMDIALTERKRALICFKKAAELDNCNAYLALANYYAFEKFIITDYDNLTCSINDELLIKAEEFYEISFGMGCFEAKRNLLELYKRNKNSVLKHEPYEATLLGQEWLKNATNIIEKAHAIKFLCDNYICHDFKDNILISDFKLEWIMSQYEELVSIDAQENYRFGEIYLFGFYSVLNDKIELEPNLKLAEKYMQKAWEAGNLYAGLKLYEIQEELYDMGDYNIKSECADKYFESLTSNDLTPLSDKMKVSLYYCGMDSLVSAISEEASIVEFKEKICIAYCYLGFYIKRFHDYTNITVAEERNMVRAANALSRFLNISNFGADSTEKTEYIKKCDYKNNCKKIIAILNDNIPSFSFESKCYYINELFVGNEAISSNKNLVNNILKEFISLKSNSDDEKMIVDCEYQILLFYALHRYKLDKKKYELINSIFEENVESYLESFKKMLSQNSENTGLLEAILEAEKSTTTVNDVRYDSKEDIDLAEAEMEVIEEYYEESEEGESKKYLHIINQQFRTESAKKAIAQKSKELIKHIKYLEDNKYPKECKIEKSDIICGIVWDAIGIFLWVKFGWTIVGILAIICGIYHIYDKNKEAKNNTILSKRHSEACIEELNEFYAIFEIKDDKIILLK